MPQPVIDRVLQLQQAQLSLSEKEAELRKMAAESERRERSLEARLLADLRLMEGKYTALLDQYELIGLRLCFGIGFISLRSSRDIHCRWALTRNRFEEKLKSRQDRAAEQEVERAHAAQVSSLTGEVQTLADKASALQRELEETQVELLRAKQLQESERRCAQ